MGVRFKREYEDISKDLVKALCDVDRLYEFVDMTCDEWEKLGEDERKEFVKTLSDDIFYALGTNPAVYVGSGIVKYDNVKHVITVSDGDNCIHVVNLV